jgi:hypothetical protein
MATRVGIYSFAASTVTSILISIIFYAFGHQKAAQSSLYSPTDVYAGIIYVFIISMIVSASIWPGIVEKRLVKK